jgi:adenylylsulfate kinase
VKNSPGFAVWLTGIPAAGKTTIGKLIADALGHRGRRVEILDGDEIRRQLSPGLGFSKEDREVHNRRVIYVASLLVRNGVAAVIPLISPYREIRASARAQIGRFVEVWVKCSVKECIRRDPKGLYRKALAGDIKDLTGLQDIYEEPLEPEVVVDTEREDPETSARRVLDALESLGYLA